MLNICNHIVNTMYNIMDRFQLFTSWLSKVSSIAVFITHIVAETGKETVRHTVTFKSY